MNGKLEKLGFFMLRLRNFNAHGTVEIRDVRSILRFSLTLSLFGCLAH